MRAVLIAAACLVGCYSPHFGDCEVSCASNVCPSGLECREGMCRVGGMTGACGMETIDAAGSGSAIPVENLGNVQRDAICDWLVRCHSFEDLATCRSALGFTIDLSNVAAGVAAGKVMYDAAKAQQCIDSFKSSTCERARAFSNRDIDPVCNEVFRGTLPAQSQCFFSEECISQNCSRQANCPNACCAGTCTGSTAPGRPTLGQACTLQDRCVDSYCPGDNMLCTAYKAAGTTCTSSNECTPGLSCLPGMTDPAMMQCRAPVATLGPCSQTVECATLADTCRANKCQTGGLIGTVCMGPDQCQLQHVCSGAAQGMCQLLPTVGESCSFYPTCRDGYCDANSMCVAKLPDGANCDAASGNSKCQSGYCDTSMSMCAPKPACF